MKKALSLIIITALLLCGCTDRTKSNPEVTPEITSKADFESTFTQDTEASVSNDVTEEAVTDDMEWRDSYTQYYLDPLKEAKSQEIKELLGIESVNDVYFADCARSGDYTLKSYYISDLHLVGYAIDTNYPQDFTVEITATQINPDTGEEKKIEARVGGNLSAKLVARADEGYVIKSYVITNDFISARCELRRNLQMSR